MKKPNLTQLELRLLGVIALLAILAGGAYVGSRNSYIALQNKYDEDRRAESALTVFFQTSDKAKAVYVYDATGNRVLYERNTDTSLPLASITKIATALTAYETFGATDTITIDDAALVADGDNGLIRGERWKRDSLLNFMLIVSSNDAAYAFRNAGKSFMETMNAYGKKIGLEHTTFYDPAGLDSYGHAGAIGTARDVATLLLHFYRTMPEIAAETTLPQETLHSENGTAHTISNTNDLSAHIETLLASKTGYTAMAGGNLAIAYRMPVYGNTIVIVVLGSTKEGRFVDIESYMKGVEHYFQISKK